MPGFFGTEMQVRLQKRSDERAEWARTTPGAYNGARMLASDNIDRLGWDTILEILDEDGVFGFRMLPASRVPAVSEKLAEHGYRIDFWETFMADKSIALDKVGDILARDVPADLTQLDMALPSDSTTVRQVQRFMLENGIAPFSGSMLVGEIAPAVTIALADAGGSIVATAHGYLPHNRYSAYHDAAWGGLVAVAESQRGRKLGTYVNAMMIRAAFERLAAKRIYELASATNIPSRRMIESCGLTLVPTLKAAAVVASGAEKFTR